MSSEERAQILKMVEEGKINADEAMKLIKALEESDVEMEIIEAAPASSSGPFDAAQGRPEADSASEKTDAPEFEKVAKNARRYGQIPMWVGVIITVLSAYWLYTLVQSSNYGFWFVCAWMPLLFGVLLLALFAGSRTSRWLYVKVQQPEGSSGPRNIAFGFPLPLGLVSWLVKNFNFNIEGIDSANLEEILSIVSKSITPNEPIIVNVDEGDNGDKVQVYIG